jgi:hypothetical protein
VDLPTYTSIWRIEKRLYKLYDFRLPMPLPIGQVTIFVAIAVPYVVLLTLVGVPFNHTLIWLYILPPGAATWLVTRPVLESKRLPELVKSQVRHLAEPRILCRMAPLAERDVLIVTGRVWLPRAARHLAQEAEAAAPAEQAESAESSAGTPAEMPAETPAETAGETLAPAARGRAVWPSAPARAHGARAAWPPAPGSAAPGPPGPPAPALAERRAPSVPAAPVPHAGTGQPRPVITVVGADRARSAPPAVERALAGPAARRADLRAGPVSVVPGGHRPGKPGLLQRDRTRVQLPIGFSARIIVLGCTVGAGQTMTALLVGEVLASLRADRVAVLDLNPGSDSVTRRAEARPALSQAALARTSRLAVIGLQREPGRPASGGPGAAGAPGAPGAAWPAEPPHDPAADAVRFEAAAQHHDLVIADPGTAAMPRLLALADQLIMVAPASAAAPGAIAMTFEWLEAHGQHDLAARSIMVLNGVSRRSVTHVEQAERVCAGRCRAIVRVPWDDQLRKRAANRTAPPTPGSHARLEWAGVLNLATSGAYTALAGVLVASLNDRGKGKQGDPAPARQAPR